MTTSRADGIRLEVFNDHISDSDELVARVKDFDIILAMLERIPFGHEILDRLPNLKLLGTTGMKDACMDSVHARKLRITVAGTKGSSVDTAEIAWGLLLSVARHIPEEVAKFREGGSQWQTHVGTPLSGRTLAIVGLGVSERRSLAMVRHPVWTPLLGPPPTRPKRGRLWGSGTRPPSTRF